MRVLSDSSWLGHSGFSFIDESPQKKIYYIDPVDVKRRGMQKADLIFITHNHSDHLSSSDVKILLRDSTIVVAPIDCLESIEIPNAQKFPVTPNNIYSVKRFTFQTIPAYNIHKDKQAYHPKNKGWVGYILELNNKLIYHAGDTDFIPEMKYLSDLHVDIACLPIGGTDTMDAYEAIGAANNIAARITIPMHYKKLTDLKHNAIEKIFKKGVTTSEVIVLPEK